MKIGRCFAHVEVVVETVVGGWRIEGGNLFGMDLRSRQDQKNFLYQPKGVRVKRGRENNFI